jgi:hypothetical protein
MRQSPIKTPLERVITPWKLRSDAMKSQCHQKYQIFLAILQRFVQFNNAMQTQ